MNLSSEAYYSEVERLLKEVVPAKFSSCPRSGQIDMALGVAHAFQEGQVLAVEAGTGVGKSLAYLIPAVLWRLNGGAGAPVISTKTINLQGQLLQKDIPLVREIMREQYGCEFRVVRALGKSNYLCRRRLANALQRRQELNAVQRRAINGIAGIINSSKSTCDEVIDLFEDDLGEELAGIRDEFSNQEAAWGLVCADTWLCAGRKCRFYNRCFMWGARRQLAGADLVVANHALVLSDAALRREGADGLLPSLKYLILDEAHNLEDVATDHLGYSFSPLDCNSLLNRLTERQTEHQGDPPLLTRLAEALGLVADESCRQSLMSIMDRLQYSCLDNLSGALEGFFVHLAEKYRDNGGRSSHYILDSQVIDDDNEGMSLREESQEIGRLLGECASLLGEIVHWAESESAIEDLKDPAEYAKNQVSQLENSLQMCLDCDNPDWVNWADGQTRQRLVMGKEREYYEVGLKVAPLEIGSFVKKYLFGETRALILTSATLSVESSMNFFLKGVGLDSSGQDESALKVNTKVCHSPFNYRRQAFFGVATDVPEPSSMPTYYRNCLDEIVRLVKDLGGRTMLLFTNRETMDDVSALLAVRLQGTDIAVLCQQGNNREAIVERLRHQPNCVLCGLDSFWEGVDVPGDALLCVVIFKLPFPVFTEPIHAARMAQIKRENKNDFKEYMIPLAVTKLRQGTGRLIRSVTDKGIIIMLDSRMHVKQYGYKMQNCLPGFTCQHKPLRELVDNGLNWLGISNSKGRFTE